MLVFKEISFKNFLSTGDNPVTIDFQKTKTTLIVGANGSGKSTMLDALSFVLFGKPHRNINKPQLVNSINDKNCIVDIKFSTRGNEYHVRRGIKPAIFEIWQNGELLNQESHARDYQQFLETNILKLNYKSFHQVVILGSGNFIPFMQLVQWQRREVIEDLLDIGIFSRMNSLLKERMLTLKDELNQMESSINSLKDKIQMQENHIQTIRGMDEKKVEQHQSTIRNLEENIIELEIQNNVLQQEYDKSFEHTQAQLSIETATQSNFTSDKNACKHELKMLANDGKFYESNTSCPSCLQQIDQQFRIKKMDQIKVKANELIAKSSILEESLMDISTKIDDIRKTLDDLKSKKTQITNNQKTIQSYRAQIEKIEEQMVDESDNDLQQADKELRILTSEYTQRLEKKSILFDSRSYHEVISEMLKDTGIKTKVLRQYLPIMNTYINQYLHILDFFVSFHLDESFTEIIRSRHRDTFGYASFSEGEKQRIDLSLLFAWRQIAKLKNSVNTNLLILDEVFDSSLDTDGVDNLLKILNTLSDDENVFIISHKRDALEGKFKRKIEYRKINNFTQMCVSS